MIKINNVRYKDGTTYPFDSERTVEKAFEGLVTGELAWNCQVLELEKTRLTVRTYVLSCHDDVTFSGTEEEMRFLVETVGTYMMADPDLNKEFKDKLVDRVMAVTDGVPLLIKLGAGMIMGKPRAKLTLLSLIGECAELEHFAKMELEELVPLVCLICLDRVSPADALELANFKVLYRMTV